MTVNRCIERGCEAPVKARLRCPNHYNQLTTRLKAYGRWDSLVVDAAPAVERIAALRAAGIGCGRIAELSGLTEATIGHIVRPGRRTVSRAAEAALLAIPVPTSPLDPRIADYSYVSALGSARRLQALSRMGWSSYDVAALLGLNQSGISKLYWGRWQHVTAKRAREIAEIFDRLSLTPGPSDISRRRAISKGWLPPLAWDNPDDPNEHPVLGRERRLSTGERITELMDLGVTNVDHIAARLGMKPESVMKQLARHEALERQRLMARLLMLMQRLADVEPQPLREAS